MFRARSIVAATSLLIAALFAGGTPATASGNLLPNPSFEDSVLEPIPELRGQQPQPVLPTGWAFEGAAGLYDHHPHKAKSGTRSAAISIPASAKRQECHQPVPEVPRTCVENPANVVKDEVEKQVFSTSPAWRNAQPIGVNPGQVYTISAWIIGDNITTGEGAVTGVRWLDANGVSVGFSRGPEYRGAITLTGWIPFSGPVQAPGNARQAVVLFGHSHDLWTGHLAFDDVSFR
ncbi:MAG TPA: hypothetical protein VM840_02135 [Actinomycetota bacterium]|nr:hypothetical protein [Actinomycetota bacterium]